MALYGQVSTFDNGEDCTQYIERLDYYFVANGIEDATKRRAILLSVVGANTYRLIRNLVAPAKQDDKTYEELMDLMKKHQCPAPSETVQRFKFNNRMRQPNESVSTYVAELPSLTHRILWISSWSSRWAPDKTDEDIWIKCYTNSTIIVS